MQVGTKLIQGEEVLVGRPRMTARPMWDSDPRLRFFCGAMLVPCELLVNTSPVSGCARLIEID